ncbi:MAG TPA: RimK family alpha-L-glutamate ligase [Candidatus Limnocylindrales bacterium]
MTEGGDARAMSADARRPRVGLVGTPELVTFPRYAESLERRGAEVVQIDPMDLVARVEGTQLSAFLPPANVDGLDGFFAPVAGSASVVMLAAIRQLEALGLPTLNRTEPRFLARDKWATAEALARAGIPQPLTFFVGGSPLARPARERIASELGFPLVVKGRLGTLGAEVRLARDADELERIVEALHVHIDDGVLLQEFFAEAGARDFRVIVLDGEVIAVKARWSGRDDEFRAAMPGYVATIGEITDEEAAVSLAAAHAIGLDLAGIDLMRTRHGPRIIEVNGHPFLATTERVTGVDIAGAVAEALLRRIGERRQAERS